MDNEAKSTGGDGKDGSEQEERHRFSKYVSRQRYIALLYMAGAALIVPLLRNGIVGFLFFAGVTFWRCNAYVRIRCPRCGELYFWSDFGFCAWRRTCGQCHWRGDDEEP
ncbi:MAG: hypothetical protein C4547_00445 [Phycisphaerales bacterium]|nr:MAG: hypothetical protein C4547_00445 [Phycisphaerales bacterium]